MTVTAKICGLNDTISVDAAIEGGAAYVGFVFFPPSRRAVSPEVAGDLARHTGAEAKKVGLFVDPSDDDVAAVLRHAELDLLQLHGDETPARVAALKNRFGLAAMKAIKVAERADIEAAHDFEDVVDLLLFDAKAPKSMADALPGGNGLVFDWNLLQARQWRCPWMLSGGLDAENVAQAVAISGAKLVDVSSGVEHEPGRKNPAAIKAFLDAVKRL